MFTIIKNLSWFIKENKKKYIVLALILLIIAYMVTIPPLIIGDTLDMISQNTITKRIVYKNAILLLLIPVTVFLLNYYFHKNLFSLGQEMSRKIRVKYLAKLFYSDSKLYEKYTKGELVSRMSNDLPSIAQSATVLFSDLFYCTFVVVIILLKMIFTISLKLTIVAFLIVPISFYVLNKWRTSMRKYYHVHRKIFSSFFESVLESIEAIRVVRSFVQEEKDIKKNKEHIIKDINSWTKIVKFENMFGPLFSTSTTLATFLTYAYGSYLVINSQISVGQVVTFAMYITMVSGPISVLANILNVISQAQVAQERLNNIFEYENSVKIGDVKTKNFKFSNLEYKNVDFKYPYSKLKVLKAISFRINKGETIAFVGPTASGKTTLIRQILREFDIQSGEIKINNIDIKIYDKNLVKNLVGYVPQEDVLFDGTIVENMNLFSEDLDPNWIKFAIDFSNMEEDISNLDEGIKTKLNENGGGLSGGQKQRLSIARAVLLDPEILILDDSLSAVDNNAEYEIINNMSKYRKDKTNIIVTHRFSVCKQANMIYVMSGGRIVDYGTHEQLKLKDGWYKKQFKVQSLENDERI